MRAPARQAALPAPPPGLAARRAAAAAVSWLAAAALVCLAAEGAGGEPAARLSVPPEPAARLSVPPEPVTVGDPVKLSLRVTHPPGAVFDLPDVEQLAPGGSPSALVVEAVEPVLPAAGGRADAGATAWILHVRPFDTGDLALGPLPLTYRPAGAAPGDPRLTVATEPAVLRVRSVLQSSEEDPADIKGPWSLPASLWPLLLWGIGLAAAAAAVYLWRRLARRRAARAEAPPAPAAPRATPYEEALRELERLLASGLVAAGRLKEFHVALAEIVKKLLGATHGFEALDRTTEEVLRALPPVGAEEQVIAMSARFLPACDLVKFARHRPDRVEIEATVALARALIETGRPRPPREAAA